MTEKVLRIICPFCEKITKPNVKMNLTVWRTFFKRTSQTGMVWVSCSECHKTIYSKKVKYAKNKDIRSLGIYNYEEYNSNTEWECGLEDDD